MAQLVLRTLQETLRRSLTCYLTRCSSTHSTTRPYAAYSCQRRTTVSNTSNKINIDIYIFLYGICVDPIIVEDSLAGKYCVAFDPLDGSSNIDCNVSTGTIFSVWEKKSKGRATVHDILRKGSEMVCAGYCCYGSATELVIAYGYGVQRFTLDPSLGEFVLTADDMRMPKEPKKIYSINDGNYTTWDKPMQAAVDSFKLSKSPYSARYVGSMVADVHRTILYGGIYLYPADAAKGNGKLRVLYEGFPMAYIVEQCGGEAFTGPFRGSNIRILDLEPQGIHDKCPVVLGSSRDVQHVMGFYK